VGAGILNVDLSDDEITKRKRKLPPFENLTNRGYVWLYQNHVEQAHLGADMDFLKGGSGAGVLRDSH